MGSDIGGQINGISLDSFLQMAQMEKTTCTLTASAGDETGTLYLAKGELIDAETGELSGLDAAHRILSWSETLIEISNECKKNKRRIKEPLMNVLMEGMKLRDEQAAAAKPKKTPAAAKKKAAAGGKKKTTAKKKKPAKPAEPAKPQQEFKDLSKPAEKIERPDHLKSSRKEDEEEEKKRPVWMIAAAVGLFIVLAAVGGYLFLYVDPDQKDFMNTLTQLEGQADMEAQIRLLQAFIDTHEKGEFTEKAGARLKEIRAIVEEADFEEMSAAVSKLTLDGNYEKEASALYKKFLETYPKGMYAEEVKALLSGIPQLLEAEAFAGVQAVAQKPFDEKIAVYNAYLEKYPGGDHHAEVKKLRDDMSESFYTFLIKEIAQCDEQEAWGKCIASCDHFITAFKDDPHMEEVVSHKIRMQGRKDLKELIAAADALGTDYAAARQLFVDYLEKNAGAINSELVKKEIDRIDGLAAEKKTWEQLVAASENRNTDIYERVNSIEKYIADHSGGTYEAEARKLLGPLLQERSQADLMKKKAAAQQKNAALAKAREEKIRKEKARMDRLIRSTISRVQEAGNRFSPSREGTVTDASTGLMWTLLDSRQTLGRCLNYSSAVNWVNGLNIEGHRDWRLPKAGELAGIYKSKPYFPASGSSWYWTAEAYVKGYHKVANIVTSKPESVFNIENQRQDQCGSVRAVRP